MIKGKSRSLAGPGGYGSNQIQGFFAALRMTSEVQKQILFGNDKKEADR